MINIKKLSILILIVLSSNTDNKVNALTFSKITHKFEMIKYNTEHDYYNNINFNYPENNNTKNFCVNCKYYLPFIYSESSHRLKYAKCNKFVLDDIKKEDDAVSLIYPIRKKAIFDYFEFCKDCRKDENKCGFEGKFYEEKFSV